MKKFKLNLQKRSFGPLVYLVALVASLLCAAVVSNPSALSQGSNGSQAASERPCPGNCLKANDPRWQHMKVAGHPDTDLWIKFPYPGGSRSWNQNHIGEVIEYVNGMPENKGRCPICGGTTKVSGR